MTVVFRLIQESGVTGPVATMEAPKERPQLEQMARDWASAQAGHPWDVLTVETEDGDCFEVKR